MVSVPWNGWKVCLSCGADVKEIEIFSSADNYAEKITCVNGHTAKLTRTYLDGMILEDRELIMVGNNKIWENSEDSLDN